VKLILALSLTLALAGCGGTPASNGPITVHQRFELACAGTGAAIAGLTGLNNAHRLTRAQVATISAAKAKIKPYCHPASGDYPYTANEVELQAVEDATNYLKGAKP